MSDYGFVAEEARRVLASVARLEAASMRDPGSKALRMNLASKQKLAAQLQSRLLELAQEQSIEVCNYRLIQVTDRRYGLAYVSDSMLNYQYLFTQIHDAKRNGPKNRAIFGSDALEESMLEVGYTYSGSLGIVLLAPARKNLFNEGILDEAIESLFDVMHIERTPDVREIAQRLGNAVVKRIHDWSIVNIRGGFDADVRWNRSNGKQLGEMVERNKMEKIVGIIESTSDISRAEISVLGNLVGIDVRSGTFHFVVPNGDSFKGVLSASFGREAEVRVNRNYRAKILVKETTIYATDRILREYALDNLIEHD